ncbi:YihY/virulence factor BrkB family protein [Deinococcus yavapaiensis]|uniref:Membrane protein n=1 Tax=Deinococcus yavapaiensis KR-236 TaxID=694435 RepID=A0A318SFF4_9DEIO|nr:YihY/virulence factor BrkB family protein [Deinococcus yavapaiensis]PYE55965.1 membrane protein [Deinococcus yavapaiensis KR-236]
MNVRVAFELLKDAYLAFGQDRAPRLAAATAYYAIFSIAPLLVLLVAIAGQFLSRDAVQEQIVNALTSGVGQSVSGDLRSELRQLLAANFQNLQRTNLVASIIGFGTLFLGATGLFAQLQDALNSLWGADPAPQTGFLRVIKTRLISFALVLLFATLILAFVVGNTALSAFAKQLGDLFGVGAILAALGTFVLSVGVFTLAFGVIFKYLPDVKLSWRDVRFGGFVTALLFTIGQLLLTQYFTRVSPTSVFGAAGSLIALLLWIYYSCMIIFFGAEVTWVYAQREGTEAGGAQNPDKKAALAQKGAHLDPTPSEKEQEAAARTPGAAVRGRPSDEAPAPSRTPPLPGARGLLSRAVLALLALPALPIVLLIRAFSRRR